MNDDIKLLDEIINLKDKKELLTRKFFWIYPFTNENIKSYYSIIDFQNKKVLCPTSSGDHILNALLKEPLNISSFDINPLAKYYVELKIAAIKTLSLEEFIMFFYNKKLSIHNHCLSKKIYTKFCDNLKGEYKIFWDYFFENYTRKHIFKSYLFSDDYLTLRGLLEVNSYLKEDNYYKLRNILNNQSVNYYDVNLSDLNSINDKFDIILLSNIPYFIENIFDKNALKHLRDNIIAISKENSKIVLNYFYDNLLYTSIDNIIYQDNEVSKYFPKEDFEYKFFESAFNTQFRKGLRLFYNYDAILISKDKK